MKLRLLAALLGVVTMTAQAAAPGPYSAVYIGAMQAVGMNNLGQVVGVFTSGANQYQAALYNGSALSTLAGVTGTSYATGINDAGQISGTYSDSDIGFLYSGGVVTNLPIWRATGIDNQGNVAGVADRPNVPYAGDAVIYNNGVTSSVNLGGPTTFALGITKGGTLFGTGNLPDSAALTPFTSKNGVTTSYENVFTDPTTFLASANDNNQFVGMEVGSGRSFLYSGGVVDYAAAGTFMASINNAGWIVGGEQDLDTQAIVKGLLWIDGVSYDINSLVDPAAGWTFTGAKLINDKNQIVAEGCNAAGCGSVLLSPQVAAVPEPETYGMMLIGIGAIGFAARRRRKPAAL